MAEEPQPDNPPPNEFGEDRKTAAALSNLSSAADDTPDPKSSNADTEKLGNALSNLKVADEKDQSKKGETAAGQGSACAAPAKRIKIDQGDVAFLVEQLEVSKTKATEMLRSHNGDKMAAITSFVVPSAKA